MKRISTTLAVIVWMAWFPLAATQPEGDEPVSSVGEEETGGPIADLPPESSGVENELLAWDVQWFGYIRAAFEWVQDDPNYHFVGDNNGFVLHNARFGLCGMNPELNFGFQISVDGAADLRESYNTPLGMLDVRLRDAFLRWDPIPYVGFQVGQFKVPFSAEELWSTGDLSFVSRAVGLEGVPVGRGFEQPGLVFGRQLGAMLSPQQPVYFGGFGFTYYAALLNGNGTNEILNDNSDLAIAGRLALFWSDLVQLGGSIWVNDRTVGELPNLYQEKDLAFAVDLLVRWQGLELFGQFITMTTEYPTIGSPDREQLAYHAQILYRFELFTVPFAPAYRFAYFHPWAQGGGAAEGDLDAFQLTYHTAGLTIWSPWFPACLIINYTITQEEAPRELENNRLDLMVEVNF
ncbi:MAG: hypothetical protein JW797_10805 [Bradymonadales bacterium]|nr:hypothetical protein [Bradymonadales bacterium]